MLVLGSLLKLWLRLYILSSVSGCCSQLLDVHCLIFNNLLLTLQGFNHLMADYRQEGVVFCAANSLLPGVQEGNFLVYSLEFFEFLSQERI